MKNLVALLSVLMALAVMVNVAPAASRSHKEPVTIEQATVVGWVSYSENDAYDPNLFVVWPDSAMAYGSAFCAQVTSATKVTIHTRTNLRRGQLSWLTGRKIFAFGVIRTMGEGEGSKAYFDRLDIYEWQSR